MIYKRNIIQTEAALLVQYYQPLLANRHKKPPGRQLMTRERFSPIQSNTINGKKSLGGHLETPAHSDDD